MKFSNTQMILLIVAILVIMAAAMYFFGTAGQENTVGNPYVGLDRPT